MELRVLKYFLIVAREENITKAAQLLHLTQPTLSRQLMQQLRHGVTVLQAEGMYSETPRSLLICVVNRHQVVRFQEILARFPDTFACVSSVNETWGNFKHVA